MIGKVDTAQHPGHAPADGLVRCTAETFGKCAPMSGRGKKRHTAPHRHGKIAQAGPEFLQICESKKNDTHQGSQPGDRSLGEQVVRGEANA